MRLPADCHLHSCHSGDSDAPMNEVIESAISKGLDAMCFTDHMDMDYPDAPDIPEDKFILNTKKYLDDFNSQYAKYSERINLLWGVELGMQPHIASENSHYVHKYPFDFVIASNHLCNRRDPFFPSFYEGRSEGSAIREFFESTYKNLTLFNDYDVLGHLDYIVRYLPSGNGSYSYSDHLEILDAILEHLIKQKKGLDVNTKALYSGMDETNPCSEVLKRYKEMGGTIITFGSDAHKSENVAECFETAAKMAMECGFKGYYTFVKREPLFHHFHI